MTFFEVLRLCWREKWIVGLGLLVSIVISAAAFLLSPVSYEDESVMQIVPVASLSATDSVDVQGEIRAGMPSFLALAQSRSLSDEVAREVESEFGSGVSYDLSVTSPQKSTFVSFKAEASSPKQATYVAGVAGTIFETLVSDGDSPLAPFISVSEVPVPDHDAARTGPDVKNYIFLLLVLWVSMGIIGVYARTRQRAAAWPDAFIEKRTALPVVLRSGAGATERQTELLSLRLIRRFERLQNNVVIVWGSGEGDQARDLVRLMSDRLARRRFRVLVVGDISRAWRGADEIKRSGSRSSSDDDMFMKVASNIWTFGDIPDLRSGSPGYIRRCLSTITNARDRFDAVIVLTPSGSQQDDLLHWMVGAESLLIVLDRSSVDDTLIDSIHDLSRSLPADSAGLVLGPWHSGESSDVRR